MVMDNVVHDYDVHMVNDHLFLNCDQRPADLILIANKEWSDECVHFIWLIYRHGMTSRNSSKSARNRYSSALMRPYVNSWAPFNQKLKSCGSMWAIFGQHPYAVKTSKVSGYLFSIFSPIWSSANIHLPANCLLSYNSHQPGRVKANTEVANLIKSHLISSFLNYCSR